MTIYKKIYKLIKKYNKIVIARHIGPDPDALGSSLALKDIILNTFPHKKVYVVGSPASKFKYLGTLDKYNDSGDALLIVTDTPNSSRVDGVDVKNFKKSIKIDHHPFLEEFCTVEWIDDKASSASQMIIELILNTKLKLTKEAAFKLYTGIIADSGRFMYAYTSPKTLRLAAYLIAETNLDFTKVYEKLYERPYKEIKFKGYLSQNFIITNNGVGYIKVTDDILKEFNVDVATPGNMINEFNYIKEMLVWVTFTEDKENNNYRVSIRSRGPIINKIAENYGGGGHIYASGTKLKDITDIDNLINDLDNCTKEYIENKEI